MQLADLDSKNIACNILILQTGSIRLQQYLEDKMKAKYRVNKDAILDCNNKTDIKNAKGLIGVFPSFSDRWFLRVDLDKQHSKEVIDLMKTSIGTHFYFCTCSRYSTFKKAREELKQVNGVVDLYINYIRRADLIYIYDALTNEKSKLTKQLFDFVAQSYSSDIDSIFELLMQMNAGEQFTNRKDITSVCGLGSSTVESYIFQFLKDLSGSAKGLETVVKNRIKTGLDLADAIGIESMYNFMAKALYCMCQIKTLMISGVVYKEIRKLPDTFDEKSLVRYQKYIWKLRGIPLSELLVLRQCLGEERWKTNLDLMGFVYRYYGQKGVQLVNGIVS